MIISSVLSVGSTTARPQRNASVIAGGNFGARPKPPKRGSKIVAQALDRGAEQLGRSPPCRAAAPATIDRASASEIWPAASSTSSRRVSHASAAASSTFVNDGMP